MRERVSSGVLGCVGTHVVKADLQAERGCGEAGEQGELRQVVGKMGGCMGGGFVSAMHLERAIFNPDPLSPHPSSCRRHSLETPAHKRRAAHTQARGGTQLSVGAARRSLEGYSMRGGAHFVLKAHAELQSGRPTLLKV